MIIDRNAESEVAQLLGTNPIWVAFAEDEGIKTALNNLALKEALPPASIQPFNIQKAKNFLQSGVEPQVLILDLSQSDNVLKDIRDLLQGITLNTRLIVIGRDDHIATYRELKHLGVMDYLIQPVEETILHEAIFDALQTPLATRLSATKTRPISVFLSARGGVGASTVAVNLAYLTSNTYGKKVCLVDLDLYNGSVCIMLDLVGNTGINDSLTEVERLDETFLKRLLLLKDENLFVFSGQLNLGQDLNADQKSVAKLFNLIREKHEFIFVDISNAYTAPIAQYVLGLADNVFIVTDLSLVSVQGVLKIKSYLATYLPNLKYKIIGNNIFPDGGTLNRSTFEKGIATPLDMMLPYAKAHMLEGVNTGDPIVKANPKHAFSKQLNALLTSIYPQLRPVHEEKPSLLKKWLGKTK